MYYSSLLFALFILFALITSVTLLHCMDDGNNAVDWFYAYKLPRIKSESENDYQTNGLAYMFITSKNLNNNWTMSNKAINQTDSIVGNTLSPIYDDNTKSDILHIFYNDKPPNQKENENKGHSKGVILSDRNQGVWLIHSVPNYPAIDSYSYPQTGTKFGQSILCLTVPLQTLNAIGSQLQYNEINAYSSHIPDNYMSLVKDLSNAANGIYQTTPPWYHILNVATVEGSQFISLAKSKHFAMDLYLDLLAGYLKNDLMVETWLNGGGRLPSNCSSKFKVKNIQKISSSENIVKFPSSKDHSKWAISSNGTWICVGDINRESSQKHRGGGTVCQQNDKIHQTYVNLINDIEQCIV